MRPENRWSGYRSLHASTKLSFEIRAFFELDRMLGNGEVIAKFEMSWNGFLPHGDEHEAFGE
jgi:hypothetical protein